MYGESMDVRLYGVHTNPYQILIGGNDGPLIEIGSDGKIHVIGPEGPVGPDLAETFRNIFGGINRMRHVLEPCALLDLRITNLETTIEAQGGDAKNPELVKERDAAKALKAAEGCS
jgi:hypothetical protein